jgi:FKBP-type peptidyl-prolyl cis-trans isomerase FkpA
MRLRHIAVALLPLAFAACLGDPVDPTANYPLVPIDSTIFAPSLGVDLAASTKTADGLYYRDITVGTGATIFTGTAVNVKYSGAFPDGTVFDPGTNGNLVFTVPGNLIAGFNEGLLGMKVGGVRQLIIPPSLAYGSTGDYQVIPPNAVLVFTVNPI